MKVWVIAETPDFAAELVGGAKEITKGAAEITAFVLPIKADAVWEAYLPAIEAKAKAEKPNIILVADTKRGKGVAPTIAMALDCPCISGCKNLSVEGETKSMERMIYGGLAVKTQKTDYPTIVALIAAKSYEPATGFATETLEADPNYPVKVTGREPKVAGGIDLGAATKVVAIGRGVSEQKDMVYAEDLTKALGEGAAMACSRPIAEFFKWMPEEAYIGISGQIIKPQLYVAAGISGQAQHIAGIRDAKIIVSVNKDEAAPMFEMSDYFIVGDLKQVLPEITKAIK